MGQFLSEDKIISTEKAKHTVKYGRKATGPNQESRVPDTGSPAICIYFLNTATAFAQVMPRRKTTATQTLSKGGKHEA